MDKLRNALVGTLLSFLGALGATGCFATGMRLHYSGFALVLGCAAMAVLLSFAFQTRLWPIPIVAAVVLFGWWWHQGTLRYSVEGLVYCVSNLYDQGYGWGVLQWSEWHLLLDDATPALLLMAFPVVLAVSATTAKGFALLGGVAAGLPLLFCLFLKDTVPAVGYLGLLLFAMVMILLTQNVRSRSIVQADRLSLMLTLPLTVALLVLFLAVPREGYNGQEGAQKIEDYVLALFEQSEPPELFDQPENVSGDQEKQVRLDRVGTRRESDKLVMTVKAQDSGPLYLRGCAYDLYDGKNWSCTPGWNSWSLYYSSTSSMLKTLTVQTVDVHSVLYFTYAPFDTERKVVGGRIRNDEDLKSYTMRYRDPVSYDPSLDEKNDDIGGTQLEEYLQLPDSTRRAAQELLRKKVGVPTETTNAGQIWKNAQYIAQWVSSRAKYDLNAPKMPAGEEDFALWFVEDAEVGYCTHFATATTVLLRAAGIPAQYVTGYMVTAEANRSTSVTQKNAHAWVEAFINGVGWVVLEPTPGSGGGGGGQGGDEPVQPTYTFPEVTTGDTEPVTTTEATVPGTTDGTVPGTEPGTETTAGQSESFSHPTDTVDTAGFGGADGNGGGTGGNSVLLRSLLWLVGSVAVAGLILLQWRVRVSLRYGDLNKGQLNHRALRRWAVVEKMSRLLRQEPPEEAFWIAQKARFSQHTITREELRQLTDAITVLRAQLKRHGLHKRLYYTLILALY